METFVQTNDPVEADEMAELMSNLKTADELAASSNGYQAKQKASIAPTDEPIELGFRLSDKNGPYRPEDGGILDCWCDMFGAEWIYVTGYEAWYRTQGSHWRKDDQLIICKQVQALMDAINRQALTERDEAYETLRQLEGAGAIPDGIEVDDETRAALAAGGDVPEWIINLVQGRVDRATAWVQATRRTRNRVSSVISMAQAQRAVPAGQLDHGNVLNLKNGTLDLDSLTLRPHDPADYLTYCLPYAYDPAARAERFTQFSPEVIGDYVNGQWAPDLVLGMVVQELMGYSLTSETKHEVMAWLSGEGGNGKTVMITILRKLLGPLAYSIDFATIGLPGNYDLADVNGKRIIFSTESERGGKVAEGYLKKVVSGETINARPIYGKGFEYESIAKVWWAMNDKPIIRDTSNSVWRRLKLIPFNRTFTDQDKDPDLINKLTAELPGILNYALEGLRRLRAQNGFTYSAKIAEAVNEYKKESNPVAQWLAERTVPLREGEWTLSGELYEDYKQWSEQTGHEGVFKSGNFGKELKRLRVPLKENVRVRLKVGNGYAVRLKTPADEAAEAEQQAQAEAKELGF